MYFYSSIVASYVGIPSHGDPLRSGASSIDWTNFQGLIGGRNGVMDEGEIVTRVEMPFNLNLGDLLHYNATGFDVWGYKDW